MLCVIHGRRQSHQHGLAHRAPLDWHPGISVKSSAEHGEGDGRESGHTSISVKNRILIGDGRLRGRGTYINIRREEVYWDAV